MIHNQAQAGIMTGTQPGWWIKLRRNLSTIIAMLLGVIIWGPFAYLYYDSIPPQKRLLDGSYITDADDTSLPINQVRLGDRLAVHWHTTPHLRDCPGDVQVEITQLVGTATLIAPVMKRNAFNPKIGEQEFIPEPWPVPKWAIPGRATYHVSTWWDCNWFQSWLPGRHINQEGPDLQFEILPSGNDNAPSSNRKAN